MSLKVNHCKDRNGEPIAVIDGLPGGGAELDADNMISLANALIDCARDSKNCLRGEKTYHWRTDDKVSPHFYRHEFACRCGCGMDTVDVSLLSVLEDLRAHFDGRPVVIQSGCRCAVHNKASGGSEKSQHLYGKAADIAIAGISPDAVWHYLDTRYPYSCGIGRYPTFTHIDVRADSARWAGDKFRV